MCQDFSEYEHLMKTLFDLKVAINELEYHSVLIRIGMNAFSL